MVGLISLGASSLIWGDHEHNFTINDNLYGHGDFGDYSYDTDPCPEGCGGLIYVVDHRDTWTNGTNLIDISGGFETVGYRVPILEENNSFYIMAWPKPLTPGTYDLILDLNVSGHLGVWTDIPNPYPTAEENITDPIWPINVTGPAGPGINVTKVASPSAGAPSTNVNFTIVVTNTGNCTLDPVKLADTLPTGMSFVSALPPADSQVGSTLTWDNVGHISASNSTTIYLIAHIDAGASGMLNNTANATGTPPAGDNVSDSDTAAVEALTSSIKVTKTASQSSGGGGGGTGVTFTIGVTNTGDSTLDPVKVEDTLPAGMSYVEAGTSSKPNSVMENIITWNNIGPLNPLASSIITLAAHIESGVSGTLTDIVNVTGTSPTGYKVTDSATADVKVEPPAQVPEFTSVGIIALIGLLSVITAINIKRRNK